jgi:hypothetical protein
MTRLGANTGKTPSFGLPMVSSNRAHEKDIERPRTPYPFDNNQWMSVNPLDKPDGLGAKRRRLPNGEYVTFASINIDPPSHVEHNPTTMRYKISPTELLTASKSIMDQVNWSEVVLDVVGRERPAFYRDAFEKILRLHIEELLRHEDTDEKRLSRHNESRMGEGASEDQRSLSTVKSTEEISSDLTLTSSSTDKRFPGLEEQGDDGSFVVGEDSEHEDLAGEDEEDDTDEDDTDGDDTDEDNPGEDYPEEDDTGEDDNDTRYETNDEDGDYEDDQISV